MCTLRHKPLKVELAVFSGVLSGGILQHYSTLQYIGKYVSNSVYLAGCLCECVDIKQVYLTLKRDMNALTMNV